MLGSCIGGLVAINSQKSTINNFRVFREPAGLEQRKMKLVMWRMGVFILALALVGWAPGQQDNRAPAGDSNAAGTADQPSTPQPSASGPASTSAPTITIPSTVVPSPNPPLAPGTLTQDQIKQLINKVAENDIENDKRQHNYTYTQRVEEHKLDGKGELKSTETKTREIMMLYGEQVGRLVEKNDKPLSEKDQAKEEERIQKIIEKRKNETDEQRRKRLEREEKDREHDREFVRDVSEAYNFRLATIQQLDGRDTYVIDADPRPGFEPHHKDARLLPKFRFRVWIDTAELQWVKLDAQCVDTVSWGVFLARLHKGSRVVIENTHVNDEVWLPRHVDVKVDARLALLKNFNEDIDVTYRDYKKFRTDAKIVGVGEVQEGK